VQDSIQELHYTPQREDKKEIITSEAKNDAFKEYEIKKAAFNIVSPIEVLIKLDNEKVNFTDKNEATLPITKGLHRVSVSFKRGFFLNTRESLIFASDREVSKEVMVDVEKDGNLVIEITANPVVDRDVIDVRVFKEIEKEQTVVKSVSRIESRRIIELYKD